LDGDLWAVCEAPSMQREKKVAKGRKPMKKTTKKPMPAEHNVNKKPRALMRKTAAEKG
jgi:hypothetical protein